MDISVEYIKMCFESREIKDRWNKFSDNNSFGAEQEFNMVCPECGCIEEAKYCGECGTKLIETPSFIYVEKCYDFGIDVWIPRQDELQKMVVDLLDDAPVFNLGKLRLNFEYYSKFDTMEKLWLAFVMKEKFQQTWDFEKNEWVAPKPLKDKDKLNS